MSIDWERGLSRVYTLWNAVVICGGIVAFAMMTRTPPKNVTDIQSRISDLKSQARVFVNNSERLWPLPGKPSTRESARRALLYVPGPGEDESYGEGLAIRKRADAKLRANEMLKQVEVYKNDLRKARIMEPFRNLGIVATAVVILCLIPRIIHYIVRSTIRGFRAES